MSEAPGGYDRELQRREMRAAKAAAAGAQGFGNPMNLAGDMWGDHRDPQGGGDMWGDRRDPRGGQPQHIGHRGGGPAGGKGGMGGPVGPPGFCPPPGLWADLQGGGHGGQDSDHMGGGGYSDHGQGPPGGGQMAMAGPGGRRQGGPPMQQGIYRGKGGKDGMQGRQGGMPGGRGPHDMGQLGFSEQDYGAPPGMHGPGGLGPPGGGGGPPGGKGGNIPLDQLQFKAISF